MFGWFKSERIAELEAKCRRIEAESMSQAERYGANISEWTAKVSGLNQTVANLQAKIRTQDEADLYFLTAKIMRRLEAGEKKEALSGQIAQQQQMMSNLGMHSGYQQGLGGGQSLFGSIFGH